MAGLCEKCSTTLDEHGACVTCSAEEEGLKILTRSGYASIREMMMRLEAEGLAAEMEKVPAGRPEEVMHPLWNLYVPADQLQRGREFLERDWKKDLLPAADAAAAADQSTTCWRWPKDVFRRQRISISPTCSIRRRKWRSASTSTSICRAAPPTGRPRAS